MKEKRQHTRAVPPGPVTVVDALTGDALGTLGNLSVSGLMLITGEPIAEDRLLQLRFELSEEDEPRALEVGAECLWCAPATQPGRYWAGFQITELSEEDRARIADFAGED